MQCFITGTDTNIGKTLIASWICLHTKYSYFKPIQTGSIETTDSYFVHNITNSKIYPESYLFKQPLSPHLAANLEGSYIDFENICLPHDDNLIIEGAGGLLVPINKNYLMIDLIMKFNLPVILVASSKLGTINHTLLSIEAMQKRNINLLGVIVSGVENQDNCSAISKFGAVEILAQVPQLANINHHTLKELPLSSLLKQIFKV